MIVDRRVVNVVLNGLGVMLAYAGMLGGAIIMPTIFKDMRSRDPSETLNEKVVFYGLIICNVTVALSGPFLPTLTKILGNRVSIVLSIVLCNAINNILFHPTRSLVYGAFFFNGFGCALLRVAALKYMTLNSTPRNLSRNTTIHWMMFTVGLMLGNLVVMFINIRTDVIINTQRYIIAVAMSTICWLGIPGYLFTTTIPEGYEEMLEQQRREDLQRSLTSPDHVTSFPRVTESTEGCGEYTSLVNDGDEVSGVMSYIRSVWEALKRRESVWLLGPIFIAGVYCAGYSPILPTAVGKVAQGKPWLISGFGVMVGVGQLCGAFLSGRVVDKMGVKHISLINTFLTLITMGLAALTLQLGFNKEWDEWMRFSEAVILIVAYFFGVSDMANNVCITVVITKVYRSNSEAGFSLFIAIMSCSMVVWYFLDTIVSIWIILVLFGLISIISSMGYVYIGKIYD